MSNTPLEQNSVDLASVLTAINNLPEYQEVAPEVALNFFSLYDAVKVSEFLDTVNIASDTTFDPTEYTDSMSAVTIRNATSQSADRSVTVDLANYIYVSTSEWFFVPKYTADKPSLAYMTSKAGVGAQIYCRNGSVTSVSQVVQKYLNWKGIEAESTNNYGIYFASVGHSTYTNGKIYLTLPAIVVRATSTLASADSLRAIDKANSNIYFRTRVYRLPHEQFANKMYTMCNSMTANERFEGDS